ncbi:MAG: epoxyqueuosine reductase QueH [Desulfohalobiaceae bacterium]|nr:epoxyqueuosine reductase QueH [Desulfohalobiaceae bacterium]
MSRERILLHICCGPCAVHPLRSLLEQGYEVVGLFDNPNIHPLREYVRRREGAEQVAEKLGVKLVCKDEEYDPGRYLREVVHREPSRCFYCYRLRLERTLSIARRGGFDWFSSTLLSSKRQKHEQIAELANALAGGGAPGFFYQDFRPGQNEGQEACREWGVYRQQYCGCIYSEWERYRKELRKT